VQSSYTKLFIVIDSHGHFLEQQEQQEHAGHRHGMFSHPVQGLLFNVC